MKDRKLAGIDMLDLEQAYRKKQLYNIPVDQLCKIHKVFLKYIVGGSTRATSNIEIQKGFLKEQ
jgi:hypothetical protein